MFTDRHQRQFRETYIYMRKNVKRLILLSIGILYPNKCCHFRDIQTKKFIKVVIWCIKFHSYLISEGQSTIIVFFWSENEQNLIYLGQSIHTETSYTPPLLVQKICIWGYEHVVTMSLILSYTVKFINRVDKSFAKNNLPSPTQPS